MGRSFYRIARKVFLGMLVIVAVGALGGAAWYYKASQISEPLALPQKPSPAERPRTAIGEIALGPSRQPTPSESPSTPPVDTRPEVTISLAPLQQFDEDVKSALMKELSSAYPEVSELKHEANGAAPAYQNVAFHFLGLAEKAPAPQQPAMLLAADFMLGPAWCPSEYKEKCDAVRGRFAEHKLALPYSELDGGSYYRHDILWRVWEDYPLSDWGERAFVLLLASGWDTSGTCSRGGDQFREVIRRGELFLEQHPGTIYRAQIIHLVGQAYATWWSLSNTPSPGMEDYVDPKAYQEGSEDARLKAVSYFEQLQQLAPDTPLAEYSRQVLPALREKKMTTDSYRFYCVYD